MHCKYLTATLGITMAAWLRSISYSYRSNISLDIFGLQRLGQEINAVHKVPCKPPRSSHDCNREGRSSNRYDLDVIISDLAYA
jgi:hypothetical protein